MGLIFKKGGTSSAETKSTVTATVGITAPTTPTISGTVASGQTLTATLQATPSGLTREIKWYRGGVVISGATNATYALTNDDIGTKISVGLIFKKGGTSSAETKSTVTATVGITAPTTPTISGTVASGQTLTATLQATPSGLTREIKWYRGSNVISGATTTSHALASGDVGNKISVGLIFKKGGTSSAETKSTATGYHQRRNAYRSVSHGT